MNCDRAPHVKHVWCFGSSYIIPNTDDVVLGGTAQKGDWDTAVRPHETEKIIDDIAQLFPSIRNAPVVSD